METNAGKWTNYDTINEDSFWESINFLTPLATPITSSYADECWNELKEFIDLTNKSPPAPIDVHSDTARPIQCVVQENNYASESREEEVNDVIMKSTELSNHEAQTVHHLTNGLSLVHEPNAEYTHSCVSHMKNNRNFLRPASRGGKIAVTLNLAQPPEEGGEHFVAINLVDDMGRLSVYQLISQASVKKEEYWNYKPVQVVMEQTGNDPTQLTCTLDRLHIYHTPEDKVNHTLRNKYIEKFKFECNGGCELSDEQRLLVNKIFHKEYPNLLGVKPHQIPVKLAVQAYLKRADDTYYPVTDTIHSNLMRAKSK